MKKNQPKKINTIYIISKGRPQCKTAKTLQRMNYEGEWYIVCGNNDETIPQYIKKWGEDKVIIFDWYKEVKETELLDNFGVEKMGSGAVPVRNATRKISLERGELRHWQFDDDYVSFCIYDPIKEKNVSANGKLFEKRLRAIAEYGLNANLSNLGFALTSETFPEDSFTFSKRVFNAHNMSNGDNFMTWRGRMNDDVINAIDMYKTGKMEMSFKFVGLTLMKTQSEKGGNTEIYQLDGTVRKTAYAIVVDPLNVKLVIKFGRYHHEVMWKNISPKLLHEKYAKV